VDLVDLHADHRQGLVQAGFVEGVTEVGVLLDVGDAPLLQDPGEPGIGVVVDPHDRGSAQVELFHRSEADALEPAHYDVVAHPGPRVRFHPGMLPIRSRSDVAG